jgi:toxin CcdB
MNRQFDVVPNPDRDDARLRPYLIILQSDLISGLRSTIVAPLITRREISGAPRLNPLVVVNGQEYWLAMHELFAIDRRILGETVASLDAEHDAIIAAIDFLFLGY